MIMTDPVADMLTRIRNANQMRNPLVSMPLSKMKLNIAEILKVEGFIVDYQVSKDEKKVLTIELKYSDKDRIISGLKRISKPGLRVYAQSDNLPRVLNGVGIAIISTSQGLMCDKEARNKSIGGEVVAYVW